MLYKADALKANADSKTPYELAVSADAGSGYVEAITPNIPITAINKPLPSGLAPLDHALVSVQYATRKVQHEQLCLVDVSQSTEGGT